MKRLFVSFLAFVMVLSLAACGQQKPSADDVDLTAPEVLEQLKAALGDTYGCDTADDEDWMTNYYGLDISKIDSWASESYSISSIDPSAAVVLRVKDGYAEDAAALLQERYEQVRDYSALYSMNQAQVGQARLFVNGNYVALLILGQTPDTELDAAGEADWFLGEAKKVDAAWSDIFGTAENQIVQ